MKESPTNLSSSERAPEQRFREVPIEASGELLAKARALIERTGSVEMRDSFEASLAQLPEPARVTVLVGI